MEQAIAGEARAQANKPQSFLALLLNHIKNLPKRSIKEQPIPYHAENPADQPFVELAEHALDVYPDFAVAVPRPPKKNTHRPDFPPGFSPWKDERDPSDPEAYPPPITHKFEEGVKALRFGTHPWLGPVRRYWERVPRAPAPVRAVGNALLGFFGPICLHVSIIEIWRHLIGWLFYTFYYIMGTRGQFVESWECTRELKEGPNWRFTITPEFWHRRGCEGGADGLAQQGKSILAMIWGLVRVRRSLYLPMPWVLIYFVVLVIFWIFVAGSVWDVVFYFYKHAQWIWVKRIFPLIKDTFDWNFFLQYLVVPGVLKIVNIWTAIWAATLGFDLFAQRPRGEPGAGQTVGLGQVGELLLPFVAPDDDSDDDDAGAGNQVPINQLPIGPVLIAPEPNNAPPPPYIPQQLNYPITGDPLYDPAEGVLMNVPPGWNAADILWVLLHYGYEAPQELIDLVNAEGLQPGAALVGEEDEQPQPSSQHVVPAVMPVPDELHTPVEDWAWQGGAQQEEVETVYSDPPSSLLYESQEEEEAHQSVAQLGDTAAPTAEEGWDEEKEEEKEEEGMPPTSPKD